MEKKTASAIMLALLLTSMLTLAFNIQPTKAEGGTIYIRADGSIDPLDAPISTLDNITYTFAGNINDSIVVERDNIVVDGAGYTLQGTGASASKGIYLYVMSNVTVKNTTIKSFNYGIYLYFSSGNSVVGNNITNNHLGIYLESYSSNNSIVGNNITENESWGIYLFHFSNNNSIVGNNLTNNGIGIELYSSSSNSIVGNNITESIYWGIYLSSSSNNVLRNDFMAGNRWNFLVVGSALSHFVNDVDVSNTVDAKPVYYLINRKNLVIEPSTYPNAGYLALVNSTNVTIEGLELKNNGQGILFAYTNHSQITNNNITNNYNGIWLSESSNNTVSGNNITNNYSNGIGLQSSSNNSISCNNITNNNAGIVPSYSSNNNSISRNNITNNRYGIYLHKSSNNMFYHNNFTDNNCQVYFSDSGYANFWDDGYPSGGNYWNDYTGVDDKKGINQDEPGSDGLGDTPYVIDADNQDHYPLMYHDIAIENFGTSKTVVGQNYPVSINVTVTNQGAFAETFNVTIYANETALATFTDIILSSGASTTLTFIWNTSGFAKGKYAIKAVADTVQGETDILDNSYTGGWIFITRVGRKYQWL